VSKQALRLVDAAIIKNRQGILAVRRGSGAMLAGYREFPGHAISQAF